jgi:hypothetical protein
MIISQSVNNEFWKAIIRNIASAILITGIFSLLNQYFLKDKLVELILNKLNLKQDIDRAGIESLFSGIDDIDYRYFFKKAKKNIDILHIYGRTWTNNNIDEITNKYLNSNCNIRVILLSPNSLFVPALADHYNSEHYNCTPGNLRDIILEVANKWAEMVKKKHGRKSKNFLKLYFHFGQPTNSIYRIDDRIIIVQTKTSKGKTKRLPSIICKDTQRADDLYSIYMDEIELIIKESQEVDIERL